jgi:hypothetical protein
MKDELEVMSQMVRLLEPLDDNARTRAVGWVISALDIKGLAQLKSLSTGVSLNQKQADVSYATFAELFHAAGPKSERERALVAAYWIQSTSGVDQFASQQVNTELKHVGYGVSNITDALGQLISDKPSLVIQLTKSGQSKQARKTYKVTDAGVRHVNSMLKAGEHR